MKTLDRGTEKIQKICDVLRQETLEPAKKEAERILEEARAIADDIRREGQEEAQRMLDEAHQKIEQERNVFHSSLDQAGQQAIETLRQMIERELFDAELDIELVQEMTKPDTIARLINAVVSSIDKEGISTDLAVTIPQSVPAKEVAAHLIEKVQKRLVSGAIDLGPFAGGAKVKLIDKRMTVEVTKEALKELVAHYVRKDFRQQLFGMEE